GLPCLVAFVAEIAASDRRANMFLGNAMGQCVDGICEVDPVPITGISGIQTKIRNAFACGLTFWSPAAKRVMSAAFGFTLCRLPQRSDVFEKFRRFFVYFSAGMYDPNKWKQTVRQTMSFFPIREPGESSKVSPVGRSRIATEAAR